MGFDKLSVVLVALFGAAFLGERLTVLNWIGVRERALACLSTTTCQTWKGALSDGALPQSPKRLEPR
jgi:drug/metabolite transporter (DMT)-like permease